MTVYDFYLSRPKDADEGTPFFLNVEHHEVVVEDEPTTINEDNMDTELPKLKAALKERFGEEVEMQ